MIASDGDIQEGVSSRGLLARRTSRARAADRLLRRQPDLSSRADPELAFSEDVGERYEAYGWHVQNLGEDIVARSSRGGDCATAMAVEDRPSLIIVRSHIGYGSPHKQDTAGSARLAARRGRGSAHEGGVRAGIPTSTSTCPRRRSRTSAGLSSAVEELEAEWQQRFDAYRQALPEKAAVLEMIDAMRMPDGWDRDPPRFDPDADPIATRKASEKAIQWAAKAIPQLVGGSADLATSTQHRHRSTGATSRRAPTSGRNLRFGVREHAMGAIVNGLGAPRLPRLRGDVPDVLRLHARRGAPVGADGAAVDLGLHARLDRPRRGRPNASADRAAGGAAGDATPER